MATPDAPRMSPEDLYARITKQEPVTILDVRTEAAMIKVYSTEMATEIIAHAMQSFGAMCVSK